MSRSSNKLNKLSFIITNIGIFSVSSLAILLLGLFILPLGSASEPTRAATPADATISITPVDGIKLNMTPTANGTFGTNSTASGNNTDSTIKDYIEDTTKTHSSHLLVI